MLFDWNVVVECVQQWAYNLSKIAIVLCDTSRMRTIC